MSPKKTSRFSSLGGGCPQTSSRSFRPPAHFVPPGAPISRAEPPTSAPGSFWCDECAAREQAAVDDGELSPRRRAELNSPVRTEPDLGESLPAKCLNCPNRGESDD